MYITIDGETLKVDKVFTDGYLPELRCGNRSYSLAESREEAGKAAREWWKDLADSDPEELTFIIGADVLVSWALGQSAGPGSVGVRSISGWLDLWLDTPEEHWAGYDGVEREARGPSYELLGELSSMTYHDNEYPWVAYRSS